MTLTLDGDAVFWWVATAAVVVAVWCVAVDTGLKVAAFVRADARQADRKGGGP
jgi:hypothetical protein